MVTKLSNPITVETNKNQDHRNRIGQLGNVLADGIVRSSLEYLHTEAENRQTARNGGASNKVSVVDAKLDAEEKEAQQNLAQLSSQIRTSLDVLQSQTRLPPRRLRQQISQLHSTEQLVASGGAIPLSTIVVRPNPEGKAPRPTSTVNSTDGFKKKERLVESRPSMVTIDKILRDKRRSQGAQAGSGELEAQQLNTESPPTTGQVGSTLVPPPTQTAAPTTDEKPVSEASQLSPKAIGSPESERKVSTTGAAGGAFTKAAMMLRMVKRNALNKANTRARIIKTIKERALLEVPEEIYIDLVLEALPIIDKMVMGYSVALGEDSPIAHQVMDRYVKLSETIQSSELLTNKRDFFDNPGVINTWNNLRRAQKKNGSVPRPKSAGGTSLLQKSPSKDKSLSGSADAPSPSAPPQSSVAQQQQQLNLQSKKVPTSDWHTEDESASPPSSPDRMLPAFVPRSDARIDGSGSASQTDRRTSSKKPKTVRIAPTLDTGRRLQAIETQVARLVAESPYSPTTQRSPLNAMADPSGTTGRNQSRSTSSSSPIRTRAKPSFADDEVDMSDL